MKRLVCLVLFPVMVAQAQMALRVNQLGYLPGAVKVAVLLSKQAMPPLQSFELCDALSGKTTATLTGIRACGPWSGFAAAYRLDFSTVTQPGGYVVKAAGITSPPFRIGSDVYDGTADFLLTYMRQQQCGYNPFLKDSCHTHDGYVIYRGVDDSVRINATGGWHDATDYLKYLPTTATAIYQMLFAYEQNPSVFRDQYDASGAPAPNGIPDILDQAKWGLDWLVKLNPADGMYFNQIADDRDHAGFRLPTKDVVSYGKGLERPVYFINGKSQGVFRYKNRTQGVSSSVGKFASSFALGAGILKPYYPEYSATLASRAAAAFAYAQSIPGYTQTAPCRAPYFYEEENYVDDLELAAAQLALNGTPSLFAEAAAFGRQEPTTPWMGADTARHYQWYPFVNLGHARLAASADKAVALEFLGLMKQGIDAVRERGASNPFLFGVPFIWCSNNLVSGFLLQLINYRKASGDTQYAELEAAMRDWLFGCNPWGTSMVIGLPRSGVSPKDPHSSLSRLYGYELNGGLVDGPIYATIFGKLEGASTAKADPFKDFQPQIAVYHDDYADYSTNEPTMDGTAGLTCVLSQLEAEGKTADAASHRTRSHGGIVRMDSTKKIIYLVFTGHEFANGGDAILAAFKKHGIRGSFFFTGDFYRNQAYAQLITRLQETGNYLGAHSDKHLLYADWDKRDSTLVTREQFTADLRDNYAEMEKFGITRTDAPYYLPPYEWYNRVVSEWTSSLGLAVVNFTPGTYSNADWTIPELGKQYLPSDSIYARILRYESAHGLNGFLLLTHIGADPRRPDPFAYRLDALITELKKRGYGFETLKTLVPGK